MNTSSAHSQLATATSAELQRRGYVEVERHADRLLGDTCLLRKEPASVRLFTQRNRDGAKVLVTRGESRSWASPSSYVAFTRGESPSAWWEEKLAQARSQVYRESDEFNILLSHLEAIEDICGTDERFHDFEQFVALQLAAVSQPPAPRS